MRIVRQKSYTSKNVSADREATQITSYSQILFLENLRCTVLRENLSWTSQKSNAKQLMIGLESYSFSIFSWWLNKDLFDKNIKSNTSIWCGPSSYLINQSWSKKSDDDKNIRKCQGLFWAPDNLSNISLLIQVIQNHDMRNNMLLQEMNLMSPLLRQAVSIQTRFIRFDLI